MPKRGTIREDGLIFWSLKGKKVDQWVTRERFEELRLESNAYLRDYNKRNPNPEGLKARKARYHARKASRMTQEELKAENAAAYQANRENRIQSTQRFRDKNREAINERDRMLKITDPEKHAARLKRRRDSKSHLTRMAEASRVRMRLALGRNKHQRSCWYLGCTWPELALHLEAQFQKGMSWENHRIDGWHIDHIIPLASANSLDELIPLLHFTNLQPLWALDNMKKGDRLCVTA